MGRCAAMSEFLVSTFDQFLQHDNCVGKGNASRIWPGLLDTLYPNLKGVGQLSRKLALVCERAFAIRLRPHVKHLHFVEFWCGSGHLSRALLSSGFDGAGLDVNLSEEHNCLMSSGLQLWMNLLMSHHLSSCVWHRASVGTGMTGGKTLPESLSEQATCICKLLPSSSCWLVFWGYRCVWSNL